MLAFTTRGSAATTAGLTLRPFGLGRRSLTIVYHAIVIGIKTSHHLLPFLRIATLAFALVPFPSLTLAWPTEWRATSSGSL